MTVLECLKLGLVGFGGLFTVTLSTRAVTRDSYRDGLITSIVAGSFYWLTLQTAIPNLHSYVAGVVYILASTAGRLTGMYVAREWIEPRRGKSLPREIAEKHKETQRENAEKKYSGDNKC